MLIGILVGVIRTDRQQKVSSFTEKHFLASRKMGPVVLGFSLCASMFSGYTCVGIPAEAWRDGFSAWRWVGTCTFISLVFLSYSPRLHYLSKEHKYDSLLSFVRDRYSLCYKSPLYWLIVVVILVPCFIYLAVQFIALSNTLNTLSNDWLPKPVIGICFGILLFCYECLGGLKAVSFTDVLQGGLLTLGALSILFFIGPVFGGIPSISEQLENSSRKHVYGALDNTGDFALNWAQFWIGVGLQRALFPDYMQRALAVRSQKDLKIGNIVLLLAPFLIQVPLCLFGLAGKVEFPDNPKKDANNIFTKVVLEIVNYSGIGAAIGCMMMAACVAAIMSTADSVLIAVSHLVTLDIGRPFVGENKLKYVSYGVTAFLCVACIPFAAVSANLSSMMELQSTFLAQLFPLFVLGLYFPQVGCLAVGAGLITGLSVGIPLIKTEYNGAILLSVGCNLLVVFLVSIACVALKRFSSKVASECEVPCSSKSLVAKAVYAGTVPQHLSNFIRPWNSVFKSKEPVQSPLYWCAIILPWFAIPFYRTGDGTEAFIGGTPTWAFTAVMVLLFSHLFLVLVCMLTWDTTVEEGLVLDENISEKREAKEPSSEEVEGENVARIIRL